MACTLDNFEDGVVLETVEKVIEVLSADDHLDISDSELERLINNKVQFAIDNQIKIHTQSKLLCYEIIEMLDITDIDDFGFESVCEAAEDGLMNYIYSDDIYVDILNVITKKVLERIAQHK